jgi:hypothetical protein
MTTNVKRMVPVGRPFDSSKAHLILFALNAEISYRPGNCDSLAATSSDIMAKLIGGWNIYLVMSILMK